ncbi:cytochrome p450 [Moniliophthora roreri MCA 2997]|uniref:Cytochrome p450 n=1 Tax=Moniliophthora roreri (strain MCA 2997) TaxID=1381753 RepID=V2X670_MONRO|nr:cytochrome p450 [Moniliophthora roreri MCA 2997]
MMVPILVGHTVVVLAFLFITSKFLRFRAQSKKLEAIPTVGSSGFISSWITAIKYFRHAQSLVQQGYEKYQGRVFKIPLLEHWQIVVTTPKLLDELRKAPDDVLSFTEANNDNMQMDHTLGAPMYLDPYHIDVVRGSMTRNLGNKFPEVRDEIKASFDELLPATNDWTKVHLNSTIMKVIARTSNRLFVGLPLCRRPDFMDINMKFTVQVVMAARMINLFPEFMRGLVGKLITPLNATIRLATKHLEPIIEERWKMVEEHGHDWPDKPNDFLTWLMEEASSPERRTVHDLVMRVLTINFAAIHTTTMTFSLSLFYLAAYPQYVAELREEVESIINEHGWTKAAMQQMRKLDSFLKEATRHEGLGSVFVVRKALKDFTFSDGTTVPKGSMVGAATWSIHHDGKYYSDPHEFKPFRFSDMREGEGEGVKHQMIAVGTEYMFFGTGRHACPGRFFAVNELKALVSHVLLNYDVKLENEGVVPSSEWYGVISIPNTSVEMFFRKRKA